MSTRSDSLRVVALVRAVEALASGQAQTLGELAGRVFDWDQDRVFEAIHEGVRSGAIAKGGARLPQVSKVEIRRDDERPASLEEAIAGEPRR